MTAWLCTVAHNVDSKTVRDFGEEWRRFDQTQLSARERKEQFERYFAIFPWHELHDGAEGFDLGCGSGRWALEVAPRVGVLHLVDASGEAVSVAKRALSNHTNCEFHVASVDSLPLADSSMDFGYSLGVLHHVPDTLVGLQACCRKLKPGAPFLVYLYYAFDNRPAWFRLLWRVSDFGRRIVCRLPVPVKAAVCGWIAAVIYLPLARTAALLARFGHDVDSFPLSIYRDRSFFSMRTDAFDRFGTRLERRFTRDEIHAMLERSGMDRIVFSDIAPYWCVVGYRRD